MNHSDILYTTEHLSYLKECSRADLPQHDTGVTRWSVKTHYLTFNKQYYSKAGQKGTKAFYY